MQRSKSAWRRSDLGAVRRDLAKSIEVLQQAAVLDPSDREIRRILTDHEGRRAALI
jgi:hypothetical protein